MAKLPTQPPVVRFSLPFNATTAEKAPALPATFFDDEDLSALTFPTFANNDLQDWEMAVVATQLSEAVPADVNKTIITLHRHEIVVERQDALYRALTAVENSLIVASSVFLMSISAASILFALSAMSITL